MILNESDLKDEFPNAKPDIVSELCNASDIFDKYAINTPLRMAHFLGQCGHESGGLHVVEENLNYSAQGLTATFPRYFRDKDPTEYARQPEKIANVVYASRMGNGDTNSGDGYRFRGRGLIQLTGKENYSRFANAIGMTLDEVVDYLKTPAGALESACWFWVSHHCNEAADADDVVKVTKIINGGTLGLDDRKKHTESLKDTLGA
jgi:putative chitinase